MNKLLSANFSRLWKIPAFWISLLAVLAGALAVMGLARSAADAARQMGRDPGLEEYYFQMIPCLGPVYALFASFFLGTEYSDGTLRNKLIVGHRRGSIYLAAYITCFAACLAITAAYFVGSLPGLLLVGPFQFGATGFLTYALAAVGMTAAFAALFTWIGTASTNKAVTVVLTLGLWLVLALAASGLNDRLAEPELIEGLWYDGAGQLMAIDPEPNALYLSGTVRVVCQCVLELLPTGQALLLHDTAVIHPVRQILFSLLLTGVILAAGLLTFRKKDLK
ncbi:MAG: ABC transporter permease [Oscillospiraceae bacterium]|nr:ABC transporter permease [Oscillospiraceae bacterium]